MRLYCLAYLLLQILNVGYSCTRNDYKLINDLGFYKFHTEALPWYEALNLCRQEGAELAILNSKAEADALRELLKRNTDKITGAQWKEQVHLAIHDLYREGEWYTVNGERLNSTGYDEWSSTWFGNQQPDNTLNNQNCGSLLMEGGMDDYFCHEPLAFICEVPYYSCDVIYK